MVGNSDQPFPGHGCQGEQNQGLSITQFEEAWTQKTEPVFHRIAAAGVLRALAAAGAVVVHDEHWVLD